MVGMYGYGYSVLGTREWELGMHVRCQKLGWMLAMFRSEFQVINSLN